MDRRTFLGVAAAGLLAAGPAAAATTIEAIRARGALRAGLSTFVPWAMRDTKGELIGYELDVGNRLAKDLGVKYEPVPTAWDGIIPALLAGTFDVIIGGMTVTPARLQSVDFTEAYSFTGAAIVASLKTAPGRTSLAEFNRPDITISGRRGTSALQAAQQLLPLATFRAFDDDAQALQEVLNGNAAAMVGSAPRPSFAALDRPQDLYLPLARPFVAQQDAMAVRKGDTETVAALNQWIAARKADGFLQERFAYWFEGRSWRSLVAQG